MVRVIEQILGPQVSSKAGAFQGPRTSDGDGRWAPQKGLVRDRDPVMGTAGGLHRRGWYRGSSRVPEVSPSPSEIAGSMNSSVRNIVLMTLLGPSQFFSAYLSVSCCSSSVSGLSPRLGQWQIIHNAFRGPIYFKMYTLFDGFLTECIVNSNNNNKAFGFHVQGSPQLSVNNITLMVRSVKKGFNWPSRQVHVGWGLRQ